MLVLIRVHKYCQMLSLDVGITVGLCGCNYGNSEEDAPTITFLFDPEIRVNLIRMSLSLLPWFGDAAVNVRFSLYYILVPTLLEEA